MREAALSNIRNSINAFKKSFPRKYVIEDTTSVATFMIQKSATYLFNANDLSCLISTLNTLMKPIPIKILFLQNSSNENNFKGAVTIRIIAVRFQTKVLVKDLPQKSRKKTGPSKITKVFIPLIILILVLSYIAYFFSSNYVTPPSPSSFKQAEWMSLIPSQVEGFRYLNITSLMSYPNLFQGETLFSIPNLNLNLNLSDVTYGLDILIGEDEVVTIIALKPSILDKMSLVLNSSSLETVSYRNIALYFLPVSPINIEDSAWICLHRGALIITEGKSAEAVKIVIDSDLNPFFSNDSLKVGYVLSSLGEDQLSFSYFKSGNNSYNVDWEMRSVRSGLTVRYLLHFPSSSLLDSKYSDVVKNIFAKSKSVYRSDFFIFGDFTYSPSEIRSVIMGL